MWANTTQARVTKKNTMFHIITLSLHCITQHVLLDKPSESFWFLVRLLLRDKSLLNKVTGASFFPSAKLSYTIQWQTHAIKSNYSMLIAAPALWLLALAINSSLLDSSTRNSVNYRKKHLNLHVKHVIIPQNLLNTPLSFVVSIASLSYCLVTSINIRTLPTRLFN